VGGGGGAVGVEGEGSAPAVDAGTFKSKSTRHRPSRVSRAVHPVSKHMALAPWAVETVASWHVVH
jgi:hypothetical protein